MSLFGTTRGLNPHKALPDQYCKCYWVNNKLAEGIELVAEMERTTKKNAVEQLIAAGLSKYMGAKVGEYIKDERTARELNQTMKVTYFVRVLR